MFILRPQKLIMSIILLLMLLLPFPVFAAEKEMTSMQWFNKGEEYRSNKDYDNAILAYSEAIAKQNDPIVIQGLYWKRAFAYFEQQKYDLSIEDYSKVIELNNEQFLSLTAYNRRGWAYYIQGEYDLAINDYNKVLEMNPQYAIAYNNRGVAYEFKGQYDLALADYNKCIELNNSKEATQWAYTNRERLSIKIKKLNRNLVQDPQTAQEYYNRGIDYANNGQYSLAIADYNRSIILNPQDAQAYFSRGDIYYNIGQYDLAIVDFSEIIKINPNEVSAYVLRGAAYTEKGLTELAKKDNAKAEALNPQLASEIMIKLVFRKISQSHIDGNVPNKADFDAIILQDIKNYFKTSKEAVIKYELLRSGPTQVGIGWPKYYLWVEVDDRDNHYEGAMKIAAQNKKLFAVENFISRKDIEKDIHSIDRQLPQSVCEKIRGKLTDK